MLTVFRRAVLRATDVKTAGKHEGYAALYNAKTGFYTKIGKVLLFPAFTKLVSPYLISLFEIVKLKYFG